MKHDTMTAGQKEKEGGYIIQIENLSDSTYKQKQNLFLSKAFNWSHWLTTTTTPPTTITTNDNNNSNVGAVLIFWDASFSQKEAESSLDINWWKWQNHCLQIRV